MAFKGTLKEFKVPDILQLISLQKKTGILTFTRSDRFITLIFENGLIIGVDAFPKKLEMRVGSVLVKQDFISYDMLQRALAIQKRTNQKIGEILLNMGLIEEKTMKGALETQAVEIILSLFKWKNGEYNFKIMDYLDKTMRIVEPIATDNLIMEGVQMLDEWPLIKNLISDENMVFEAVSVDTKKIKIIEDYDEINGKDDKIYLTDTEANLLRYINGKNTVRDLVELGIFTQYKVYKNLYNLINKSIIKARQAVEGEKDEAEIVFEEMLNSSKTRINKLFNILILVYILILLFTLFTPLKPLYDNNLLMDSSLLEMDIIK